jgi:hypothetical protein
VQRTQEQITSMFRVALKQSAREQNCRVGEIVSEEGPVKQFNSRSEAEEFADEMCSSGDPVRLQSPAPQDPADVDAYLISDTQRNEWEPIESNGQSVTFPVGANTYGGLGFGLVYLEGKTSPALAHYFTEQAPPSKQGRVVWVDAEPQLPDEIEVGWSPDLRIEVSPGDASSNDVYFAEVKSGNSSFERQQRDDMQRVSEDYGVLRIRVKLARLPKEYTVLIAEVSPNEWPV